MESQYEVLYKGCTLTPLAVEDGAFYTAMLILRAPDGGMRASGALGQFACALSARRYALAYGMADVDHREPPLPDWPPVQARAAGAVHRARA
ncbi:MULTISPECIES: hypothetical protein [unclassified Caballeronia]|uniref:hypothetical protein n=1 Tax=unclassified Caballeronia TaxID=2646786 RepID=UPI0028570D4F|nr:MULTISPECIES: hypothetical protein [unclassified Caballeronia]MDR5741250.1 hypothetical protein [Caballeronia sp. LZ016]MDR5807148.1 hypothetical protein [Caballeronia sp. LZ019]